MNTNNPITIINNNQTNNNNDNQYLSSNYFIFNKSMKLIYHNYNTFDYVEDDEDDEDNTDEISYDQSFKPYTSCFFIPPNRKPISNNQIMMYTSLIKLRDVN